MTLIRRPLPVAAFLLAALPALSDPAGVWEGHYICMQGTTQLRLTIRQVQDGKQEAFFAFSPMPNAQDRSSGCFLMQADALASTGAVYLRQKAWTSRPPTYVMVDLDGRIDLERMTFVGRVIGPGCSFFTLKRVEKEPETPESCMNLGS
jgi:hypothetical protein